MRFKATIEGDDPLGIAKLVEQYANSLFIPTRLTPEDAAGFVLDHFRRTIASALERVELGVVEG